MAQPDWQHFPSFLCSALSARATCRLSTILPARRYLFYPYFLLFPRNVSVFVARIWQFHICYDSFASIHFLSILKRIGEDHLIVPFEPIFKIRRTQGPGIKWVHGTLMLLITSETIRINNESCPFFPRKIK